MTQPGSKNLAASIHQRLLNQAHKGGRTFQELLQTYANERFLYRLSQSPFTDQFVLKGALLLAAWGMPHSRPTRDIDLLGYTSNAVENLVYLVKEVCTQQVEPDGMVFEPGTVQGERIKEDADYEGVRVRFAGFLGPSRVVMQIDLGFADVVSPAPIAVDYPTLLSMPAPRLRGYSRESVISEKVQAAVYLGAINSRMKDFYDLWVLSHQFEFDGTLLQEAIQKTFQQRNTLIPEGEIIALSESFVREKQPLWEAFLRRNRLEDVEHEFSKIVQHLETFIGPPLAAGAQGELFSLHWLPGGYWR